MADLDHFKTINDKYGHPAGDGALRAFAAAIKHSLKPGDLAGRLGGEEFGLLLLGEDQASIEARLDKLSREFQDRSAPYAFKFPTVSYGVTTPQDGDSIGKMFVRADFALYLAKEGGRNRVVVFSEEAGLSERMRDRRYLRDSSGPR